MYCCHPCVDLERHLSSQRPWSQTPHTRHVINVKGNEGSHRQMSRRFLQTLGWKTFLYIGMVMFKDVVRERRSQMLSKSPACWLDRWLSSPKMRWEGGWIPMGLVKYIELEVSQGGLNSSTGVLTSASLGILSLNECFHFFFLSFLVSISTIIPVVSLP